MQIAERVGERDNVIEHVLGTPAVRIGRLLAVGPERLHPGQGDLDSKLPLGPVGNGGIADKGRALLVGPSQPLPKTVSPQVTSSRHTEVARLGSSCRYLHLWPDRKGVHGLARHWCCAGRTTRHSADTRPHRRARPCFATPPVLPLP